MIEIIRNNVIYFTESVESRMILEFLPLEMGEPRISGWNTDIVFPVVKWDSMLT